MNDVWKKILGVVLRVLVVRNHEKKKKGKNPTAEVGKTEEENSEKGGEN